MTSHALSAGARFDVVSPVRRPAARLYAFPHAGGTTAEFRGWAPLLPDVEVRVLSLPGRPPRFDEPALTDLDEIARGAAGQVEDDLPFAFVGHSFGALVAFETCRRLRARRDVRLPGVLFCAAFPAPDAIPPAPALHTLDDQALLRLLASRFDAIPAQVYENEQLAEIVAGYVRSDYQALETYACVEEPPLDLDLVLLSARDDVQPDTPDAWARHVTGTFSTAEFDGGHFFLRRPDNLVAAAELVRELVGGLRREGAGEHVRSR